MNLALSGLASDSELDNEDKINAMVEGRKLVKTASYFAFTLRLKTRRKRCLARLMKKTAKSNTGPSMSIP